MTTTGVEGTSTRYAIPMHEAAEEEVQPSAPPSGMSGRAQQVAEACLPRLGITSVSARPDIFMLDVPVAQYLSQFLSEEEQRRLGQAVRVSQHAEECIKGICLARRVNLAECSLDREAGPLYSQIFGHPIPPPEAMDDQGITRTLHEIKQQVMSAWSNLPDEIRAIFGPINRDTLTQDISQLKRALYAIRSYNLVQVGRRLLIVHGTPGSRDEWIAEAENVAAYLSLPNTMRDTGQLVLSNLEINYLPLEITHVENLKYLDLSHNRLSSLPAEIGRLKKLKQLWVGGNRLSSLPGEIEHLKKLRILDISGNQLTRLPEETRHLKKLEHLLANQNRLQEIGFPLANLRLLQTLELRDNELSELPIAALHSLAYLQTIDVRGNHLTGITGGTWTLEGLAYDYKKSKIGRTLVVLRDPIYKNIWRSLSQSCAWLLSS